LNNDYISFIKMACRKVYLNYNVSQKHLRILLHRLTLNSKFNSNSSAPTAKFHYDCIKRSCEDNVGTTKVSNSPLEGIRVLDLTRILAGPFCTMVLGDLGAEIIKVEHPDGDDTRRWGPPFVEGENGKSRESCYFLSVNRNKKSIGINFKHEKGITILRQLAEKSDVLIENFLPGKLSTYGLDYDSLKSHAPHLIHCSISGFGQEGPYKDRAGYDVIAASIGGLMHITGPKDGAPCKVGVAMTDITTGLYAHGAIMAALLHRHKTGKGQKIDCDLLSTQVSTLVNLSSNYLNGGLEAKRLGTAHASIVPYETFETADGYFTIGCGNDAQFRDFCGLISMPELADAVEYRTNEDRVNHRVELIRILTNRLRQKSNAEWNELFGGKEKSGVDKSIKQRAKFPYGPVNNLSQVFQDPQVKFSEMETTMEHNTVGKIKQVGPAVKFSSLDNRPRLAPPPVGYHTREVLSKVLNINEEEIESLQEDGAIST